MGIQSVIFDKERWTVPAARKWLKAHKFRSNKVDTTDEYHRFRQYPPDYENEIYRTKTNKNGIKLIVGIKK